jgi:hypothetical protein
MTTMPALSQRRIALLIDCDNVSPEVVGFALDAVRAYGKVSIRRGYGGYATLGSKWKDAMLKWAVTPHLHYSVVSGKNTSDIALALDGLELAISGQADLFCIVTSDSDFAYLCTRLRERGCMSCVIGEAKTPDALRSASDYFHKFVPALQGGDAAPPVPAPAISDEIRSARKLLTAAVRTMHEETGLAQIPLPKFGQFLRERHPSFSFKVLGHASLSKMLSAVPMLDCRPGADNHTVQLRAGAQHRCTANAVSG